jgi:hypothetical protein
MSKIGGTFTQKRGAFIDVNISKYGDSNPPKKIRFKIDTGSPIVVINSKLSKDLKLKKIRDADNISLAGDTEAEGWHYTFLVMEIPELNFSDQLEVLVCPNPTGGNLLGRDILIKYNSYFYGEKESYIIEK